MNESTCRSNLIMEFFKTCFAGETLGLVQVGSQARGRFACHDKSEAPTSVFFEYHFAGHQEPEHNQTLLPSIRCASSVTFVIFCLY